MTTPEIDPFTGVPKANQPESSSGPDGPATVPPGVQSQQPSISQPMSPPNKARHPWTIIKGIAFACVAILLLIDGASGLFHSSAKLVSDMWGGPNAANSYSDHAISVARQIILDTIKSPASAIWKNADERIVWSKDNKFIVAETLDAQNDYGAMIRAHYLVSFWFTAPGKFEYMVESKMIACSNPPTGYEVEVAKVDNGWAEHAQPQELPDKTPKAQPDPPADNKKEIVVQQQQFDVAARQAAMESANKQVHEAIQNLLEAVRAHGEESFNAGKIEKILRCLDANQEDIAMLVLNDTSALARYHDLVIKVRDAYRGQRAALTGGGK